MIPPSGRSAIHGRGLFCKRNIDAGEMVIEYSGTVIRSVLTDKREKFYDSKVGAGPGWGWGQHMGALAGVLGRAILFQWGASPLWVGCAIPLQLGGVFSAGENWAVPFSCSGGVFLYGGWAVPFPCSGGGL